MDDNFEPPPSENDDSGNNPINPEIPSDSPSSEKPLENITSGAFPLGFQQIVEKELGLVKIMDFLCNDPLELAFHEKMMEKYHNELNLPLFDAVDSELDSGRSMLKDDYNHYEIAKKQQAIIDKVEEYSRSKGIKESLQKKGAKISTAITFSMFLIFILSSLIESINASSLNFLFLMVICILPRYIQTYYSRKWADFKRENQTIVLDLTAEFSGDIHYFAQNLLNDVRDRLVSNRVPLEKISFQLLSDQYANLFKVNQSDLNGLTLYTLQFSYPDGMESFLGEQPRVNVSQNLQDIPEDDENDEFIILKNAEFDDDGALGEYFLTYPPQSQYSLVESLLTDTNFENIQNPRLVLPSFRSNSDITCECGEPIKFTDLKTGIAGIYGNFEYYFGIGEKCRCGKNPFVLFNSPGNREIPELLKDLFLEK